MDDGAAVQAIMAKVTGLHDHKGKLTVFWGAPPTEREAECMKLAWEGPVGDGCGDVQHEVKLPS